MAGEWVECGAGGSITEEHWVGEGADLVGLNWSRSGAGKVSWEHLRIGLSAGKPTYFASPKGRQARPFLLASSGSQWAVFENRAHDFPKRITYRRDGETLNAAATDLQGRGPSWSLRRKTLNAPCPRAR
jgi:hypothetical protein